MNKLIKSFVVLVSICMVFSSLQSYAEAIEVVDPNIAVPELVKMGIPVTVKKYKDPRFDNLEFTEDKYYLDVQLGQLTLDQFNQLINLYGRVNSVKFNSEKSYNLIDFLPLTVQSVVNKIFTPVNIDFSSVINKSRSIQKFIEETIPKADDLPDNDPAKDALIVLRNLEINALTLRTNCWNTTIETLNFVSTGNLNYNLQIPGRIEADNLLNDTELVNSVSDLTYSRIYDFIAFYKKSKSNDKIQLSNLNHTTLLIGENLVFEKTDSSENDPYRIALLSDVMNKYKKIFRNKFEYKIGRIIPGKIINFGTPFQNKYPAEIKKLFTSMFAAIKKKNIIFDKNQLYQGCENADGGGCNMSFYQNYPAIITVDSITDRGVLKLPIEIQNQFQNLSH